MAFHEGLDWGGTRHAVCVIDGEGQVVLRIDVRHDAAGLAEMVVRLKCFSPSTQIPIAIERHPA